MFAAFRCVVCGVVILLSAISVFTGYAFADDDFPVSDERARVHVIMPGKPVIAVTQDRDAKSKTGGMKQERSWKVIRNGAMWLVSSTVLPKDVAYDQPSQIAVNIAKASSAAAAALRVAPDSPVMVLDRVVRTIDGRPVEWRLGQCRLATRYVAQMH